MYDKPVFALPCFSCLRILLQWMDDLSTRVVLFTISVHLQKRQCESELHQTKQKTFYLVGLKQVN